MYALTASACIVAALLLAWRLVSCWDSTGWLARVLAALLGASVTLSSIAAAAAAYAGNGGPVAQIVLALVLAHAVSCIGAAAWPMLQAQFAIPRPPTLQHR